MCFKSKFVENHSLRNNVVCIVIIVNYLLHIDNLHQKNQASDGLVSLFINRFMYIVKGSITNDPDIMLREVKNYKLQIPPCIQVFRFLFFLL